MESSKLSDGRSPGNKGARPCKSVSLPDPFTLPVFQRTPVQRSVRAEPCPGVLLRRFTKLREWEILENGPEAYPVILPQSPSRFLHNLLQGFFLFYPAIKRANADSQSAVSIFTYYSKFNYWITFNEQWIIYFQNNPFRANLENFVNGNISVLLENRCNWLFSFDSGLRIPYLYSQSYSPCRVVGKVLLWFINP